MRSSRWEFRTFTAGLALVAVLSGRPVIADDSVHAPADAALAAIGIDNFGKVNDKYFRGAQPKGEDFKALSALGVKLVIDLASEGAGSEEAESRAAGMSFVRIPMTTRQVPSPAVIAQFLSLVNDPANQPVYVHCQGGRHRTGAMTAVYRMTHDKWTADQAYAEMRKYEFEGLISHPELKSFVFDYYTALAKTER